MRQAAATALLALKRPAVGADDLRREGRLRPPPDFDEGLPEPAFAVDVYELI
jgi:hypothetical protein